LPDESKTLVYVVDDDASVRNALEMLLISAGVEVLKFESAEALLQYELRKENACLIVDLKMKGLSGLELQQKLAERGTKIPIIFLTAFDSKESRLQAKRYGAVGFFRKPVDDQALLDTIQLAVSSE
jgi:FixJ family two-component response regulator